MFSIKVSDTLTIDFFPIIVVLVFAIVFSIGKGLVLKKRWSDAVKAYYEKQYDVAIIKANKLLKVYLDSAIFFKLKNHENKNIKNTIENLHLFLATLHLAKSDDEQFFKHIQSVSNNENIKEFWLSLYYVIQNEIEEAKSHYKLINDCAEMKNLKAFLEGMFIYKENKFKEAKEKIEAVYPALKDPLLKDLALEIIS